MNFLGPFQKLGLILAVLLVVLLASPLATAATTCETDNGLEVWARDGAVYLAPDELITIELLIGECFHFDGNEAVRVATRGGAKTLEVWCPLKAQTVRVKLNCE